MRKLLVFPLLLILLTACNTQPNPDETNDNAPVSYSMEEVNKYSNAQECWIAIDGKVYDATDYIENHPPGSESILSGCGKEYTKEKFEEISPHTNAGDLLKDLYIGELSN